MQLKDAKGTRVGAIAFRALDEHCNSNHQFWRFGWFAIEPTLQTAGYGKILLAHTEQFAKDKGATQMFMTVLNRRFNLLSWYERRGYQLTGQTEPFSHDIDKEDAVIHAQSYCFLVMEKQLT
jgi:GNAT superfamily N-acetyltransferase